MELHHAGRDHHEHALLHGPGAHGSDGGADGVGTPEGFDRSFGRWIQQCSSSDDITLLVVRFPALSPAVAEQDGEWSSRITPKSPVSSTNTPSHDISHGLSHGPLLHLLVRRSKNKRLDVILHTPLLLRAHAHPLGLHHGVLAQRLHVEREQAHAVLPRVSKGHVGREVLAHLAEAALLAREVLHQHRAPVHILHLRVVAHVPRPRPCPRLCL